MKDKAQTVLFYTVCAFAFCYFLRIFNQKERAGTSQHQLPVIVSFAFYLQGVTNHGNQIPLSH